MAGVACRTCGKFIQRKPCQIAAFRYSYCSRTCQQAGKKVIRLPDWRQTYNKQYRKENLARHNELNVSSSRRIKSAVFELLGNCCCRCGFTDARALQVEHVHRAVERHGEPGRAGSRLYAAILRGDRTTLDFQLLCANCNWIKRFENNEHNGKNKNRQLGKEPDGGEVING